MSHVLATLLRLTLLCVQAMHVRVQTHVCTFPCVCLRYILLLYYRGYEGLIDIFLSYSVCVCMFVQL